MNRRHRKALSEAHQRGRGRRADAQHSIVGRAICRFGHADLLSPTLFEAEIGRVLDGIARGVGRQLPEAEAAVIERTALAPGTFFWWCRTHTIRVREWIAESKTPPEGQAQAALGITIHQEINGHDEHTPGP